MLNVMLSCCSPPIKSHAAHSSRKANKTIGALSSSQTQMWPCTPQLRSSKVLQFYSLTKKLFRSCKILPLVSITVHDHQQTAVKSLSCQALPSAPESPAPDAAA